MDKENIKSIPYIAFEAAQSRSERYIKRLIIALIISILLGFATNLAWLWAWNQYDYESESITKTFVQDGEGLNIIGNSNEAGYGTESNIHNTSSE